MRHGVRIRHLESSFLEVLAVIEQRAADKERAFRIDHDTNAVGLHQNVAVGRTIHKIHLVLQTGTTTPDDCHSESALRTTLPLE